MSKLWRFLAILLVRLFYPVGRINTDLDDTLFHHSGKKVDGAGWWRDAVRSGGKTVVYGWGLNLVVLTLRVNPPWGGKPLGLPINMRLHRKKVHPGNEYICCGFGRPRKIVRGPLCSSHLRINRMNH